MSKYKVGDKFIVEIKEVMDSDNGTLYRSNFSTLVFDDYGLDKLQKINPKLKIEDIDDMLAEHDLKKEAYEKGLNDAWELVEKIFEMPIDEREKALSIDEPYLEDILVRLTPQEALKRLKAYEGSKAIKVGDVVECFSDYKGVVLDYDNELGTLDVFSENGCVEGLEFSDVKKTGRHIDIEHILEQIRGDEDDNH